MNPFSYYLCLAFRTHYHPWRFSLAQGIQRRSATTTAAKSTIPRMLNATRDAHAKGLLISAIRDNNPVIYLESKPLYRTLKGYVPEGDYVTPIGEARVARPGEHLSIITYGAQVHQALAAAEQLAQEGIDAEILDLRTLKPLDTEAILATACKTGKVLIVHSATRLAGVGAELAALIAEQAFEWLDAPIQRLGGLDVPVPFSAPLEDVYRPNAEKIVRLAQVLARY